MTLIQTLKHRLEKEQLFEYFVVQLDKWKKEVITNSGSSFSKLQLQKLLFLVSAQDSTLQFHPMLDIFDRFYALKYGPVEMDIYDAMTQGSFKALSFGERMCEIHHEKTSYFDNIPEDQRAIVDDAIKKLRIRNPYYILKDPFESSSTIPFKCDKWPCI